MASTYNSFYFIIYIINKYKKQTNIKIKTKLPKKYIIYKIPKWYK